jgi:hypothetical protein
LPLLTKFLKEMYRPTPGPTPSYTKAHLILVVLSIGDSGAIGRQALARETGVGEGAIRTMVRRLKQASYLKTFASGCTLLGRGERLYGAIKSAIPRVVPISRTKLTVGSFQSAALVKGLATVVTDGIAQRDAAVWVGADGATTLVILGSKIRVPRGSQDCETDYPDSVWAFLRKELLPEDNDVMILCGARDQLTSRIGALSAALTLLE